MAFAKSRFDVGSLLGFDQGFARERRYVQSIDMIYCSGGGGAGASPVCLMPTILTPLLK